MKISVRYGFAFLCMPKCASTSIETAIGPLCDISFTGHPRLKHINARAYAEVVRPLLRHLFPGRDIETFCLVRNPFEWIESWYRYRSRKALRNPSHRDHRNYTGEVTYEQFIEAYIAPGKRPPYAMIRRQQDFVSLENGRVGIDRFFPMERMDRVAAFLSERTGRKIGIRKLNVSPLKRRPPVLGAALRMALRDYLSSDLELYETALQRGEAFKEDFSGRLFDGV